MTQLTVKALSDEIGTPVDRLIEQLADAGMKKASSDTISEDEKQNLLTYLRKGNGDDEQDSSPTRLTLQRKTRSTLSVNAGSGKSKNVQVEVRKKRTFVKRSAVEDEAKREAEEQAMREAEELAKREAEEQAKREAEEAVLEQERKAREDEQRRIEREKNTFRQLSQDYLEHYAKPKKRSWKTDQWYIQKVLNPEFGKKTAEDLRNAPLKIEERGRRKF